FLVLMVVETLIALYVHDKVIRPYVGDMLVVLVVYCFVRIVIPVKARLMPLYVFVFAACVEVLQYFDLVTLLGLSGNRFARIVFGSVFDVKDLACYAAGCLLLEVWERRIRRKICGQTGQKREEPGSGGKNRKWREEPEVARRTGIKEAIKNEDSR
ncbi:DUF2809 domain-containing protein, partial [Hungatella hathewayi]|uniref:ribosomal maturation YjgA family protein n=1 Tax=Hungatella hathewayi TaxID=154046 RepID=UPI0032E4C086